MKISYRVRKINHLRVWIIFNSALLLCNWCNAQQPSKPYSELLISAVRTAGSVRGSRFRIVRFDITEVPWPEFRSIKGLDDSQAVPFLIDILNNGPGWTDEKLLKARGGICPHIARCYAALCLGTIGDKRAFDPLKETLLHGDFLENKYAITYNHKEEYHISDYAALALGYLGDPNAVEPMLNALEKDKCEWAIYGLTILRDVRAVKPIITYASDRNRLDFRIHRCLEYITRARFKVKYSSTSRKYTVLDFPGLGELESGRVYKALWQHWLKVGDKFARERFEEVYPKLKLLQKERPDDRPSQYWAMREAIRGGIPTLPYIIERIDKGDETMVPAVIELLYPREDSERFSGRELSKNANRMDCLNWWKENKEKLMILQAKK